MTTPWALVIVLTVGIGAFAIGRATGYSAGSASQRAEHDRAAVKELEDLVSSSAHLVLQANQASNTIRATTTRLLGTQRETTKELENVLFGTQGDRMLCRFDADSMRIVREAREAAAAAAAGGVSGSMP